MDKARTIALVEGEILRKVNRASLCGALEAQQLLEVADALTAVLDAYRQTQDWTAALTGG